MAIVAGFDRTERRSHSPLWTGRRGEVRRGRIRATPEAVREWVEAFAGADVHVAVEAGTGGCLCARGAPYRISQSPQS